MIFCSRWARIAGLLLLGFLASTLYRVGAAPEPALFSVGSANIDVEAARNTNELLFPEIAKLVRHPYFRHVKIDLDKPCPFWRSASQCMLKDCAVQTLPETDPDAIQAAMYHDQNLGDVKLPGMGQSAIAGLFARYVDPRDFCVLEDETSPNAVFVNLLENPERFTGYSGAPAASIWQAIYDENCFNVDTLTLAAADDVCLEKQFFYRIISGLHASISVHICAQYLDKHSGLWIRNRDCYWRRVGDHPDRIANTYLVYALLLRAVDKVAPLLPDFAKFLDDEAKSSLDKIARRAHKFALDESDLFQGPKGTLLVDEVRTKFRNISQIMDCVSCQKCRLWGKTQVTGIGTALKVLFAIDERVLQGHITTLTPPLSKWEVVALMNTLNRFAESIHDIETFARDRGDAEYTTLSLSRPALDATSSEGIQDQLTNPEKHSRDFWDGSLSFWRYTAAIITLLPFAYLAIRTYMALVMNVPDELQTHQDPVQDSQIPKHDLDDGPEDDAPYCDRPVASKGSIAEDKTLKDQSIRKRKNGKT